MLFMHMKWIIHSQTHSLKVYRSIRHSLLLHPAPHHHSHHLLYMLVTHHQHQLASSIRLKQTHNTTKQRIVHRPLKVYWSQGLLSRVHCHPATSRSTLSTCKSYNLPPHSQQHSWSSIQIMITPSIIKTWMVSNGLLVYESINTVCVAGLPVYGLKVYGLMVYRLKVDRLMVYTPTHY